MTEGNSHGAASTGHHLTTDAAISILKQGGNAFDGAIAAAGMACVCEPVLASPGGGGFALAKTASQITAIDFFAQTPLAKSTGKIDFSEICADFGTAVQKFHIGNASSATPGFVPGLLHLHEKYASLPLSLLLKPAITAARSGVTISPFQHYLASVVAPILTFTPQSKALFEIDGALLPSGKTFTNTALAGFFQAVANDGPGAFAYAAILADQTNGGHLRQDDFDNYRVVERDCLSVNLGRDTVFLNPPPCAAGPLIAAALANLKDAGITSLASALAYMDDLKTGKITLKGNDSLPQDAPAYRGTTHISIIDGDNNACSLTLSNGEGNGHLVEGCGFMMNNMLGEADINPGGALGWPVNTRMSSMMCPTIVERGDGSVYAIGSGGSNRIRSTIFQVLAYLLFANRPLAQAIDYPRLHVEDGHLDFEAFFDEAETRALTQRFAVHRAWKERNMFFGGCHGAGRMGDGTFTAAGDDRRHGNATVF